MQAWMLELFFVFVFTAVGKQEMYERAEAGVCSHSTVQRYGSSVIDVDRVGGYMEDFDLQEITSLSLLGLFCGLS